MDRTVPRSGNEEIALYLRTYYSLLRSSRPVPIKALIEAHKRIRSSLHIHAEEPLFDVAAFTYAVLRLPDCFRHVRLVLLGQSEKVFAQHGYDDVESWQQVTAPGRRRRSFFDGRDTLAVYIASRSDIDDLVPMLTAYQIERRKLHERLNSPEIGALLTAVDSNSGGIPFGGDLARLASLTDLPQATFQALARLWREDTAARLKRIATFRQEISIRSLAGSLADYKRATRRWWRNVERAAPDIAFDERPVYFVSSNTHSLTNILSGFALRHQAQLEDYIAGRGSAELRQEYADIQREIVPSPLENFFYYVWKKYEADYPDAANERLRFERDIGIIRVPSAHAFDIEVQVFPLRNLNTSAMDPRLQLPGLGTLTESDALIVNIDYPLGLAAYQVLSEVARNIDSLHGIYIMGKAATLNGRIGDVMIPNVVHDEHSLNTYLFDNCFTAADVAPHLVYGSVLDNQKAITVPGTFLQNDAYMSIFYKEGYTDMEMEGGPYLSAIYELVRPQRHPRNEVVNLHHAPFPIGMLHYASDTPFSKGQNLGARNLSYYGMDPTYATMIAIGRAILATEVARLETAPVAGKEHEALSS